MQTTKRVVVYDCCKQRIMIDDENVDILNVNCKYIMIIN